MKYKYNITIEGEWEPNEEDLKFFEEFNYDPVLIEEYIKAEVSSLYIEEDNIKLEKVSES